MSFLDGLFGKKKRTESVVLIDIVADSVAGAYAYYVEDEKPSVLYTRRLPVEAREGESQDRAMLRALKILADTLISEGAPVLARATGSGAAGTILVSIDAPWQETSVRTEHFEAEEPFVFTRNLVDAKLGETVVKAPGKMLADESIIGTILNGYETRDPYGKRVRRASVVVLTSLIDEKVAKGIATILQAAYHTKNILPIAGSSLRYQAMYKAFPHERDALIVDATGPLTSLALLRHGLLATAVDAAPADTADAWVEHIRADLTELAKQYPLPRTIFLLAREAQVAALQKTLSEAKLADLWLSDNPPKVVSVLPSHISGLVRQVSTAAPDLLLLLMALYFEYSAPERG